MSFDVKQVHRRQSLTPIDRFTGVCCKPTEFFEKTGHRNAVLAHPNGDCETIDFANLTCNLKDVSELAYLKETTRLEIYHEGTIASQNVSMSILYGGCVNLSEYPIAVFRGTGKDAKNVLLYVPCFWE